MRTLAHSKIIQFSLLTLILALALPAQGRLAVSAAQPASSTDYDQLWLASASDHLVTEIVLTPSTSNVLPFNQNVDISFNYKTVEPGGVRIFARPFTAGALTPNYAAHGSDVYPTGSGSGSGFFTITAGEVTVDQIRFQMYNADQSTLLFEAFIPVHYQFKNSTNLVSEIVLTPSTSNVLPFGQNVDISFKYNTNDPGGVRIFARPFTGSDLTPNYAAHGSDVYPTGSGSGSGFFTISSGPVVVDHIRFQMYNADQSTLLFETLIPVHYQFTDGANLISEVSLNPQNPNIMEHGADVNITFKYQTSDPGGVRILARPLTAGALTPESDAHGSGIHPTGSGNGTGFFTINSGPAVVDHIRFRMYNADRSVLLFETVIPVHYQYGTVRRLYLPWMTK